MNNRPHLLQVLRSLVVGTLQEEGLRLGLQEEGLRLGRGSSHSVVEIELEHRNHELDHIGILVTEMTTSRFNLFWYIFY